MIWCGLLLLSVMLGRDEFAQWLLVGFGVLLFAGMCIGAVAAVVFVWMAALS
jgi:hypothetical protein